MEEFANISWHARCVISLTHGLVEAEEMLQHAEVIEDDANNGYYDDDEGCRLMLEIARYIRTRASQVRSLS